MKEKNVTLYVDIAPFRRVLSRRRVAVFFGLRLTRASNSRSRRSFVSSAGNASTNSDSLARKLSNFLPVNFAESFIFKTSPSVRQRFRDTPAWPKPVWHCQNHAARLEGCFRRLQCIRSTRLYGYQRFLRKTFKQGDASGNFVLNAFRHQRFLRFPSRSRWKSPRRCSTPFGIKDFCADGAG